MTTKRCYKNALSVFDALNEIKDEMFNECDRDLFEKFVKLYAF
jgi:HD-GYP domain-containing protein (c-di-GMP phosphodiesterase class II)